jgi:hypothetical protein
MRTIDREMRKPSRSNSTALRTMQKEEDAADGEKGLHGRHRRAEELSDVQLFDDNRTFLLLILNR